MASLLSLPSFILKKFYKFVLTRCIGEFVLNDININDLEVQLNTGIIVLYNLQLNIDLLNQQLIGVPIICVEGTIKQIECHIPYNSILTKNTKLILNGLQLIFLPTHQVQRNVSHSHANILAASVAELQRNKKLHHTIKQYTQTNHEYTSDSDYDDHSDVDDIIDDNDDQPTKDTIKPPVDSSSGTDPAIQLMARFLEQILSRVEFDISDVCIKIQHVHNTGSHQTVLAIKLPWLSYSDITTNDRNNTTDNNTTQSTNIPSTPSYEYNKIIKFHSFHIELGEQLMSDDIMLTSQLEPQLHHAVQMHSSMIQSQMNSSTSNTNNVWHSTTSLHESKLIDKPSSTSIKETPVEQFDRMRVVMHGDVDSDCMIQLKIRMHDQLIGPRISAHCFIRSLRAVMSPKQVAQLSDLLSAIGIASAKEAVAQYNVQQSKLNSQNNNKDNMNKIKNKPLTTSDYLRIESMLSQQQSNNLYEHIDINQQQFRSFTDSQSNTAEQTTDTNNNNTSSSANNGHAERNNLHSNLWGIDAHILHANIVLLYNDGTEYPDDWWLTAVQSNTTDKSIIHSLQCDHILISTQHLLIDASQTSVESNFKVSFGNVTVHEYLQQIDINNHVSQADNNDLQYKSSIIATFDRNDSNGLSIPDIMIKQRTAIIHELIHRSTNTLPISNHCKSYFTIELQPLSSTMDLGIFERCARLYQSIILTQQYLSLYHLSDTSSILNTNSLYNSILVTNKAYNNSHEINSIRYSTDTVISIKTINLNLLFPDISNLSPSDTITHIDTRGPLRHEQLHIDINNMIIYNQLQLPSDPTIPLSDVEWIITLQQANVYLHYLSPYTQQVQQKCVLSTQSVNNTRHSSMLHKISITIRAPPAKQTKFEPAHGANNTHPHTPYKQYNTTSDFESLFMSTLTSIKWWEPANTDNQSYVQHSNINIVDNQFDSTHFNSSGTNHRITNQSISNNNVQSLQTSTQATRFEQLAAEHSSMLITVNSVYISLNMSKTEYDCCVLLYDIYSNIFTPSNIVHDTNDAAINSGSDVDSDSSDDNMFESVIGADSVILNSAGQPYDQTQFEQSLYGEFNSHHNTSNLSDGSSSSVADVDELHNNMLHSTQFGTQSMMYTDNNHINELNPDDIFAKASQAAQSGFWDKPKRNNKQTAQHERIDQQFGTEPSVISAAASKQTKLPVNKSPLSTYIPPLLHRHLMTLHIIAESGTLCLHDDIDSTDSSDKHTYNILLDDFHLFNIIQYHGHTTNYISLRTGDILVQEYGDISTTLNQLYSTPSTQLLYRTLQSNNTTVAPVLVINFVISIDDIDNKQHTLSVINGRDLTMQLIPTSNWVTNLTKLFAEQSLQSPTQSNTLQFIKSINHSTVQTNNIQLSSNTYVHGMDCVIDYNPFEMTSRMVLAIDFISFDTKSTHTMTEAINTIELRDVTFLLHNQSDKPIDCVHNTLQCIGPPHLHNIVSDHILTELESQGFARIGTLDVLEIKIKSSCTAPSNTVIDINNGLFTVMLCSDSFNTLIELSNQLSNTIAALPNTINDVDVVFTQCDTTLINTLNSAISPIYSNKPSSIPSSDVLNNVDNSMFGQITTPSHQYYSSNNSMLYGNSISTALQQATQRDLYKASQQPISSKSHHNTNNTSYIQSSRSPAARHYNTGHTALRDQQSAKFYTEHELQTNRENNMNIIRSLSPATREQKRYEFVKHHDDDNLSYGNNKLHIIDDYITIPVVNADDKYSSIPLELMDDMPTPLLTLNINHFDICIRMFDGHDWSTTEPSTNTTNTTLNIIRHDYVKAMNDTDTTNIKSPAHQSSNPTTSLSHRSTDKVIELHVKSLNTRYHTFSTTASIASRIAVSIDEFELHDCIVTSPYKKLLCRWKPVINNTNKSLCNELQSSHIRAELSAVRPDVIHRNNVIEYRIQCSIAPIRIHADQDAVEFLLQFFKPMDHHTIDVTGEVNINVDHTQQPVSVDVITTKTIPSVTTSTTSTQPYIQSFSTTGPIRLCIDYTPKRLSMRGLEHIDYHQFINLYPLESVELQLIQLQCNGCDTFSSLLGTVILQWSNNIVQTQKHQYIAGIQPIRSIVQVGNDMVDLLILPYTSYKMLHSTSSNINKNKHGRHNNKSQQSKRYTTTTNKSAGTILRSLASDSIAVAAQLANGAKSVLETVDEFVSQPTPMYQQRTNQLNNRTRINNHTRNNRTTSYDIHTSQPIVHRLPPVDMSDGFRQAYDAINTGLQNVTNNMIVIPSQEYHRIGTRYAVKSVLRSLPSFILQPMIGVSDAVAKSLTGIQHTVQPKNNFIQQNDKYKKR